MSEPLMTARQVADYLNVHRNTIKRLVKRGELPYHRITARGDLRFQRDSIEAWLAERRHGE